MILKNISILYGNELKLIESTNVQIKNEKFQKISKNISSKEKSIDCSNLLLIPGFVNSHTHIADSIGKDLSINADVDSKIHPMFGLKQKLLKETPKSSLSKYIKKSGWDGYTEKHEYDIRDIAIAKLFIRAFTSSPSLFVSIKISPPRPSSYSPVCR